MYNVLITSYPENRTSKAKCSEIKDQIQYLVYLLDAKNVLLSFQTFTSRRLPWCSA